MKNYVALICSLLVSLLCNSAEAQTRSPSTSRTDVEIRKNSNAETVFSKTASKIVLLITRKLGDPHAQGSGILLSADGYIATNYHVLKGADAVEVRFFPRPENPEDYQSFNSTKLYYADRKLDIAILKVSSDSLPFARCQAVRCLASIGERAYAIGNPKGLSNTISEGIVSALRVLDGEDTVQHTAAISPGSSGGALVDMNGDLLGMNSWQVAEGQNLNFAISARHLLDALTIARTATTPLSFPADNTTDAYTDGEDNAQPSKVALEALEATANAIKACPRVIWFEMKPTKGPMSGFRVYFGPPMNVLWDVVHTDSVRSRYMGYVEFTVPRSTEIPADVYEKYKNRDADLYRELYFKHQPSLKYRYEFDAGPKGLRLTRMLSRSEDETEWRDGSTSAKACSLSGCSTLCWEIIAENAQIVSETPKH